MSAENNSYNNKEKRSRAPSILFKDNFLDMDDFSDFEDEEMDSEMKDIFENLAPLPSSSSSSSSHRSSLLLPSAISSPVLSLKHHEDENDEEDDEEMDEDLSSEGTKKTKGKVGNFKCKACGEAFNESWTLANHAKSNHPDYPRRDEGASFKRKSGNSKKFSFSPLLTNANTTTNYSSSMNNNNMENKNIKTQTKRKRGRPPKGTQKNYFGKTSNFKSEPEEDEEVEAEEEEEEEPKEEPLSELGEIIQQILTKINYFEDGMNPLENQEPCKNFEVFKEFDGQKSKKRKLSDFLAKNIDALMQLSTKVEVSMQDFRNSTLGEKVRQKLDNLKTLKKAMELGLIFEEQFEEKQKQFLDSFSFSLPS